jgi:hypothetical protein
MLIQPPEIVSQNLATRISEVRGQKTKSCLDQPKIAAKHLKTKEDLNMFYGESHEVEATIVIVVVTKAIVVAGALLTAAIFAVNGPSAHSSSELANLALEEVDTLSINDLLNARQSLLT